MIPSIIETYNHIIDTGGQYYRCIAIIKLSVYGQYADDMVIINLKYYRIIWSIIEIFYFLTNK